MTKAKPFAIAVFSVILGLSLHATAAMAQGVSLPGPSAPTTLVAPAPDAPPPAMTPAAPMASAGITDENYQLGTGDKLRVNVYGEEDLSGEFLVDGSGQVQLPLVGQVKAKGLTIHQFVAEVTVALSAGYLKDPKVSVEVENYRPFYIMGEVNKPGEYPYENGLTVLGAVALAGGYTYRADDSEVYIRHNGSSKEETMPADSTTKINPGDIVRISERIF
ncbi:MAG: polysaccharide biosynthesis/export family protein [Rhizomicrobium sp.]